MCSPCPFRQEKHFPLFSLEYNQLNCQNSFLKKALLLFSDRLKCVVTEDFLGAVPQAPIGSDPAKESRGLHLPLDHPGCLI